MLTVARAALRERGHGLDQLRDPDRDGWCRCSTGALVASPRLGIGDRRGALPALRDRPAVSRTLSYAILTALLVGTFVGLIALTTNTLALSGRVGVAASTLAAAALFNPLRVRIQRLVDRRFNRARYDAEATVAAFTARLRDAVEIDAIRADLLDAVNRAVQPPRRDRVDQGRAPGEPARDRCAGLGARFAAGVVDRSAVVAGRPGAGAGPVTQPSDPGSAALSAVRCGSRAGRR